MILLSWFCTNSTKNLFVKIVHPGGHVELHDRPILAADLLNRNPKCCVAHPTVFQQPYDIVSPDTILALGRKYYVVPLGTIRKLQNKYSPARVRQYKQAAIQKRERIDNGDQEDYETDSSCWLMRKKSRRKATSGPRMSSRIKVKSDSNSENSSDSRKPMVNSKKKSKKESEEGASPSRLSLTSIDYWQPGLESITEEQLKSPVPAVEDSISLGVDK